MQFRIGRTTRGRAALVLGVFALAGLAAIWPWPKEEPRGARAAPTETVMNPPPPPPAELMTIAAPQIDAREQASAPVTLAPEAKVDSTPAPANEPSRGLSLAGTLVVVDEQGVEHRTEDGAFSFVLWTGDTGSWHKVEVHGGRWSTELPSETKVEGLGLEGVQLGGRGAVALAPFDERFAVPSDGWLTLTARWPSVSVVRVRDRESGRELAPVLFAEVHGWPESEYGHPGTAAADARDLGPSPIVLPPSKWGVGMRNCYFRSPGHGWGRIEIDERRGGERILLLERAGELEVVPTGRTTDPATRLRVFGSEYQPVFSEPLADTVIEDLPVGSYRVAVEIGEFWSDPLVLAEEKAEVVAGVRTRVVLALKDVEAPAAVPMEGTLFLPAEWALTDFELDFELLGTALGDLEGNFSLAGAAMRPEGEPPSAYRWVRPAVQPGRYEVELEELAFHAVLEVGEQGLHDARVVVPPPCDVRVRCVDDITGVEVTGMYLTWNGAIPEGLHGWSSETARWNKALRCWEIRAPVGEVQLGGGGNEYEYISERIDAHPGLNEVLLRLARQTSLRLILLDGTTEIPWESGTTPTLEPAEGQTEWSSWTRGGGMLTLHKKEPGRYKLTVPEIPGYEPVPAVEVTLVKGVVTEHVVELVRRP